MCTDIVNHEFMFILNSPNTLENHYVSAYGVLKCFHLSDKEGIINQRPMLFDLAVTVHETKAQQKMNETVLHVALLTDLSVVTKKLRVEYQKAVQSLECYVK